jgi:hypothetical protein
MQAGAVDGRTKQTLLATAVAEAIEHWRSQHVDQQPEPNERGPLEDEIRWAAHLPDQAGVLVGLNVFDPVPYRGGPGRLNTL